MKALIEADLREAYAEVAEDRRARTRSPRPRPSSPRQSTAAADAWQDNGEAPTPLLISGAFKHLEQDIVRNAILDTGRRIDGRDTEDSSPDSERGRRFCRARMARRCSPAARRKPWW